MINLNEFKVGEYVWINYHSDYDDELHYFWGTIKEIGKNYIIVDNEKVEEFELFDLEHGPIK